MRTPDFWDRRSVAALALLPAASLYRVAVRLGKQGAAPFAAPVPVICVGNLVAGGAGKTPVAMAVLDLARDRFAAPHFLTRGYGGRERGPLRVDIARHSYLDVGDEALLLATHAPTWVSRDRRLGVMAAVGAGADAVIMDDGFQNPSVRKDLSLLVIDGAFGFGNGFLLPAGPLREPIVDGVTRAQAAIVIGDDVHAAASRVKPLHIIRAALVPDVPAGAWEGRGVVAFAGIGRPAKFFDTLRRLGAEIVAAIAFPDHHRYLPHDLASLAARAQDSNAVLVTTAKDAVRLPAEYRARVETLPVSIAWESDADRSIVAGLIARLGGAA